MATALDVISLDSLDEVANLVFRHLLSLALATARPSAFVMTFPLFVRLGLTGLVRGGFVVAISLPVMTGLVAVLPPVGTETLRLVAIGFKEAVIGGLLGLLLGIPFWAAEVAGDLLDYERQAPDAQLQDPNAMTESTASGTLFMLAAVVVFVVADGLHSVAEALYGSYRLWPVVELAPSLRPESGMLALEILIRVLQLALILAFPVLAAMFVAMFALMVIARFAPQLNVFDLSLAARNLVYFLIMPLYAAFLVDHFGAQLGELTGILDQLGQFLR
jgi:type III secretion protein T